jgi:hypothetical protein
MSYTTDRTWVQSELVDATLLNAYLRDNMKWLSTDKPMCRVYHNAAQELTSGTEAALALNSERFDNATMHDTSSNNSRITFGTAGKYLVGGSVEFEANATGRRYARIRAGGSSYLSAQRAPADATNVTFITVSTMYAFSAAEYAELTALQTSGGGLDIDATGNLSPEFYALWVGV